MTIARSGETLAKKKSLFLEMDQLLISIHTTLCSNSECQRKKNRATNEKTKNGMKQIFISIFFPICAFCIANLICCQWKKKKKIYSVIMVNMIEITMDEKKKKNYRMSSGSEKAQYTH